MLLGAFAIDIKESLIELDDAIDEQNTQPNAKNQIHIREKLTEIIQFHSTAKGQVSDFELYHQIRQ